MVGCQGSYPSCHIGCTFDQPYAKGSSEVYVRYDPEPSGCMFQDASGQKVYLSNSERRAVQSFLVDAERSISYQLSYTSKYTLLGKFSHAVHDVLGKEDKEKLGKSFEEIKSVFEGIPDYKRFADEFSGTVADTVQGFAHRLAVDFSAYDPNNYANAMRILAKEGNDVRTFEEFGTGEQQVLLMAFAKAYMQVFGSESFVLILEEPEAHLHPLAQRWLKEYIYELCASGLQVVVSTHSADFLDPGNLEGLVKVSKGGDGVTKAIQLSAAELVRQCVDSGVPAQKVSAVGIADHYAAKLAPDALKGLFAKTVLLVEGASRLSLAWVILSYRTRSFKGHNVAIIAKNAR